MFEAVERLQRTDLEPTLVDEDGLRESLLELQFALRESRQPLVVLLCGMPGSGRTRTLEKLLHWCDGRGVTVHAATRPSDDEQQRPAAWRWWIRLPEQGRMTIFLDGWVQEALTARLHGALDDAAWQARMQDCVAFEQALHQAGIEFAKIWLHVSPEQQRQEMTRRMNTPGERWNVTPAELLEVGRGRQARAQASEFLQQTSTADAPWTLVPAFWDEPRAQRAALAVCDAMHRALARPQPSAGEPDTAIRAQQNVLQQLDLSASLSKEAYRAALAFWSARMRLLARMLHHEGRALVLVFEGMDAAGKGGAIRRLTDAIDPRWYDVHAISAPDEVERAHPWLWRFWRNVPKRGKVAIFDRSWYGRVLVERIEGFCSLQAQQRAWSEIPAFERELVGGGQILAKFWIHVDADEQLARFRARQDTGYKRHKLTEEDWRNRQHWHSYEQAAADMIQRTHSADAPWFPIAGNCKRFARVAVLEHTCRHIADVLGLDLDALPEPADETS